MLTRSEHLLACLAEECDEVGQRVMKALRFGPSEVQPGQPLSNAERIVAEYIDLIAVMEMLHEAKVVSLIPRVGQVADKKAKVEQYMRYAEECAALQSEGERTMTEAELSALRGLAEINLTYMSASEYADALPGLLSRGFVRHWAGSIGAPVWQITPAGRAALAERTQG